MDRFKALLSQNHSKDFLKFGIGALASLTHEKGQSALLEIYQNSETELPEKRMILTALTVTDTPSTASTQLLLLKEARESESTLRESALYALGAALKKETNPEKRIEINHFILETYLNSNDENLKRIAIDSMGNSGDKTFLPSLKKSLLSQNSEDRERAAFALRFMPPAESQTLLNLALKDTNENVRRSAEKAALIQTQKE